MLTLAKLALGVRLLTRSNEPARIFSTAILVVGSPIAIIAAVHLVWRQVTLSTRAYFPHYAAIAWLGFAAGALLFLAMLATAIFACRQRLAAGRLAGGVHLSVAKAVAAAACVAAAVLYTWDLADLFVSILAASTSDIQGWLITKAIVS